MIDSTRTSKAKPCSTNIFFFRKTVSSYLHDHDNLDWILTEKLGYDQGASSSVGIQVSLERYKSLPERRKRRR